MYDLGSMRVVEKESGVMEFRYLRPQGPIAGVEFLRWGQLAPSPRGRFGSAVSSPSGVRGGVPTAQRFSCTSRSPGSLFCYVIEGKQLQNSLNLTARGVAPTPWGPEIT